MSTPTKEATSLADLLAEYRLEGWQSSTTAYPITPEILEDKVTYGALHEELDNALQRASKHVELIEQADEEALVELRWNGISSYGGTTQVDIFLRDHLDPDHRLWIVEPSGTLTEVYVNELSPLLAALPGEVPASWRAPVSFVYLDDPWDDYARGMQAVDLEGTPIAFWDHDESTFRVWKRIGPLRDKLVNGFDIDFYGFTEEQLELLWEAFWWIDIGLDQAPEEFQRVISIRSTDLPETIAGVAGRGDVRLDPLSLTYFRDNASAPRLADVIWIAGLLVHEMAHVNQPGECTEAYAATQGMTLEEFALFRETGPGQAYDQEVRFLQKLLELKSLSGNPLILDAEVREILSSNIAYTSGAIGREKFPNGDLVPTCANNLE